MKESFLTCLRGKVTSAACDNHNCVCLNERFLLLKSETVVGLNGNMDMVLTELLGFSPLF